MKCLSECLLPVRPPLRARRPKLQWLDQSAGQLCQVDTSQVPHRDFDRQRNIFKFVANGLHGTEISGCWLKSMITQAGARNKKPHGSCLSSSRRGIGVKGIDLIEGFAIQTQGPATRVDHEQLAARCTEVANGICDLVEDMFAVVNQQNRPCLAQPLNHL